MNKFLQSIILFLLTFIVAFIIYKFFNDKYKPNKRKKKKDKGAPAEIRLLEGYFKVNISKLNYNKLLNQISFISSLDIAIIITISCISKIGLVRILVAIIIMIPVIFLSYLVFSKYCINKINKEEGK